MLAPLSQAPYKYLALFSLGLAVVVLLVTGAYRFFQERENGYYKIGVIINTVEITPEDLVIVKFIIGKKIAELNAGRRVNGKPLQAIYIDDKGSADTLYAMVKKAASDPDLIAFVGCRSSLRASAIAPFIGKEQIPFIGGFSVNAVSAPYPNIYSMDVSMREVGLVLTNLLKQKATRAAYIGQAGDLYSEALLKVMLELEAQQSGFNVVLQHRYPLKSDYSPEAFRELANRLKENNTDFLLVSADQGRTNLILEGLWKEGVKLPVFTGLADMAQVKPELPGYQDAELFDVGLLGIPGTLNARLQERLDLYKKDLQPEGNLAFQVGFGGRHADAIGLIWKVAQDRKNKDNEQLPVRERINQGLQHYQRGNQIYHGWFANWFFTADRFFGGEELLAWKPSKANSFMLAPFQFLRQGEDLLPAGVIYTSLDLVELNLESDEAGTFEASFYLEMTSAGEFDFKDIDFANAARNTLNHQPLVEGKLIRRKVVQQDQLYYNYLYKVTGKFLFEADLKTYPFDEQSFPITIQTGRSEQDFLVQPPEEHLRDLTFDSPGWTYRHHYVGYDQDIISTDTSFSSLQKNIPLYKFSFVYQLKRARIDFTLKTLVPLLAILIITYFSVYIPAREFEAMAAVQVTALLSAIALYFATSKPEMPYATISDKIFIFSYIMITSLVGTSILIYVMYRKSSRLKAAARIYQRLIFPVIVIFFTFMIRS